MSCIDIVIYTHDNTCTCNIYFPYVTGTKNDKKQQQQQQITVYNKQIYVLI